MRRCNLQVPLTKRNNSRLRLDKSRLDHGVRKGGCAQKAVAKIWKPGRTFSTGFRECRKEAQVHGIGEDLVFRVPLHTDYKTSVGPLQSLDDAISGITCRHAQSVPNLV